MLTQLSHRLTTPVVPEKTTMSFGPRRGLFINAADRMAEDGEPLDADTRSILLTRLICFIARSAPSCTTTPRSPDIRAARFRQAVSSRGWSSM